MNTTGALSQPKSSTQFYSQVAFINPGLYYNPLFKKNNSQNNKHNGRCISTKKSISNISSSGLS